MAAKDSDKNQFEREKHVENHFHGYDHHHDIHASPYLFRRLLYEKQINQDDIPIHHPTTTKRYTVCPPWVVFTSHIKWQLKAHITHPTPPRKSFVSCRLAD